MRFIVFYNDHPKVKDFDVRVWDNAAVHPNFNGEMTHAAFIRHYHFDPKSVSSVGNIDYDSNSGKWVFMQKNTCLFLGTDKKRKLSDLALVLKYVNSRFGQDKNAQDQSLHEQEMVRYHQRLTHLRKKEIV